ncbi:MAG: hypothetical protein CMN78_04190 [Spirochaetales bacterium]|nr:hypothetical protein [Spirochaetales bacterium]
MGKIADRRSPKIKRQLIVIILSVIIAALLGVIVALLPEGPGQPEPANTAPTGEEAHEEPGPSEIVKKEPPKLFIIIDDVGNNLRQLDQFLNLPFSLSFAIMPKRPFSEEAARRILAAGHDIILHQPMEPVGEADPGAGVITTDMNYDEIHTLLRQNLASVPGVVGINNHMGSKATANRSVMAAVLDFVDQNGLFFVDSLTTDDSVAEQVAEELQVEYAKRNSIFLDNHGDISLIREAVLSGTKIARESGYAILIGHVQTGELAPALADMFRELSVQGFTFSGIQDYQFN